LPTSSAHCSNSSRQNFTQFSGSLERLCSCRTQSKTRKSVDRVSSKRRPKYAQNAKFQPPPISPPNGGRFPQTKTIFLRVTRAIRCKGQVGVRAPKGVNPPNFRPPIFSKTLRQISPKSLLKAKGYLKCVNLYFGPDLTTTFYVKLPTVFGFFGVWGNTPPASRELDHQFSSHRADVGTAHRARRRATLPGSGDRLGGDTAARNPTSGLTGPEVVIYAIAWPSEPIDEASQTM